MMEKRLITARKRHEHLQEQELEFKNKLKEKWRELAQKMESYIDTSCEYLSQTVHAAGDVTQIFSSILNSLQSEMKILSNSYKTLHHVNVKLQTPQQQQTSKSQSLEKVERKGSKEKTPKTRKVKNKKSDGQPIKHERKKRRQSPKTNNQYKEFNENFPSSMHRISQSLQYATSLNHALERCLEIGSLDSRKNSKIQRLMENLNEMIDSSSKEQQKQNDDDQHIATQIQHHVDALKDFQCLLSTDQKENIEITLFTEEEQTEDSDEKEQKGAEETEKQTSSTSSEQTTTTTTSTSTSAMKNNDQTQTRGAIETISIFKNLISPTTGKIPDEAIQIMKNIEQTSTMIFPSSKIETRKKKENQGNQGGSSNFNFFPLLLSPSVLIKKQMKTIRDDHHLLVDEILDRLVDVREPNVVKLTSIFLLSFRYFMNSDELLEKLIYRYCSVPSFDVSHLSVYKAHQLSIRLRTVVFIKSWLTHYKFIDFKNEKTIETLSNFLKHIVLFTGNQFIAKQLLKLLNAPTFSPPPPTPLPAATTTLDVNKQQHYLRSTSPRDKKSSTQQDHPSTEETAESKRKRLGRSFSTGSPMRHSFIDDMIKSKPPQSHSPCNSNNHPSSSSSSQQHNTLKDSNSSPQIDQNASAFASFTATTSSRTNNNNNNNDNNNAQFLFLSPNSFCILDCDCKLLAEQLTAFHFIQFKCIPEIELLQQRFSHEKAPHISNNSRLFNQLGGWILHQILTQDDLKIRVDILRHILSLCIRLYQLNNYNAVISIVAALNNSAIDRLRGTWCSAGRNVFILKEAFTNLTRDNFSLYRKELQSSSPPCIPFIGMFLTDLTYIEDGNPNFLDDGSLNFTGKFTKIANSVSQLLGFQDFSYPIDLQPNFRIVFERLKTLSEEQSYSHSETLEPRQFTYTIEKFEQLDSNESILAHEILSNIKNKIINDINDIAPLESEVSPELRDLNEKPMDRKRRKSIHRTSKINK